MGIGKRYRVAASLLALASHASAQVASVCPSTDVCFKLNIPESTTSSGNGDIFFQLSAPSTYEWVALGQGESMSGSNIFVMYTAGNGNVTVSPRLGRGHQMPEFNSNAQITLLEGSGVSNGKMVANVRCASCNSWSGGSASFSGNNGNWIYAYSSSGGPKDTTSQSADIPQHNQEDSFLWSYANAKGGNSVNPLLSGSTSSGTGNGGSASSCIPRAAANTGSSGASGSAASASVSSSAGSPAATSRGDDDDDKTTKWGGRPTQWGSRDNSWPTAAPTSQGQGYREKRDDNPQNLPYCEDNSGFTSLSSTGGGSQTTKMVTAHAALAALAFVMFFPVGSIAIRLASFTGVVWFHAAFQVLGYLIFIAAFGIGVYLASTMRMLQETHPIIGIVVFVVLFFQPILGLVHHSLFKKYQTRTIWSHGHIWIGRSAITLGIINGGLGFKLAGDVGSSGMIAYSVCAGVIWLIWVAASIFGETRRKKAAQSPPVYKERDTPRGNSDEPLGPETSHVPHPENGHYAPPKN
ncbi:unnamed protein product [Periconia digitata]|uniref:Uncharacterized protein n=1 Tax=Periconia digitata TaxID=1303443 RepID=A0A9W4UFL1_9PLEO|nr:unnamed protein product [Periconia digitata]